MPIITKQEFRAPPDTLENERMRLGITTPPVELVELVNLPEVGAPGRR